MVLGVGLGLDENITLPDIDAWASLDYLERYLRALATPANAG